MSDDDHDDPEDGYLDTPEEIRDALNVGVASIQETGREWAERWNIRLKDDWVPTREDVLDGYIGWEPDLLRVPVAPS